MPSYTNPLHWFPRALFSLALQFPAFELHICGCCGRAVLVFSLQSPFLSACSLLCEQEHSLWPPASSHWPLKGWPLSIWWETSPILRIKVKIHPCFRHNAFPLGTCQFIFLAVGRNTWSELKPPGSGELKPASYKKVDFYSAIHVLTGSSVLA